MGVKFTNHSKPVLCYLWLDLNCLWLFFASPLPPFLFRMWCAIFSFFFFSPKSTDGSSQLSFASFYTSLSPFFFFFFSIGHVARGSGDKDTCLMKTCIDILLAVTAYEICGMCFSCYRRVTKGLRSGRNSWDVLICQFLYVRSHVSVAVLISCVGVLHICPGATNHEAAFMVAYLL